jgi:low affinity Fe/Cu permease
MRPDPHLFRAADFISRPPGFYRADDRMHATDSLGLTDVVTFGLSVAAIIITGVVLVQVSATPPQFTRNSMRSWSH